MRIRQFEIWIADLNPLMGAETGKIRPVLIVQSDLLNSEHPSTIVYPITVNDQPESKILRVHLKKGMAKLKENCDVMKDQVRAIDNKRLLKKTGRIPEALEEAFNPHAYCARRIERTSKTLGYRLTIKAQTANKLRERWTTEFGQPAVVIGPGTNCAPLKKEISPCCNSSQGCIIKNK
ncbi:MAG: type II toxin-antitoxin system PemK/MazF family toxin [Flavisolibacter sp.]|jgi:mRNA interferase MazF|nr:type II toxin-antitoxin system PemK/MazF family toxin [Flavisolibacter sp.]